VAWWDTGLGDPSLDELVSVGHDGPKLVGNELGERVGAVGLALVERVERRVSLIEGLGLLGDVVSWARQDDGWCLTGCHLCEAHLNDSSVPSRHSRKVGRFLIELRP